MAAKEKRGLGIGLDALFGPDLQADQEEIRQLSDYYICSFEEMFESEIL